MSDTYTVISDTQGDTRSNTQSYALGLARRKIPASHERERLGFFRERLGFSGERLADGCDFRCHPERPTLTQKYTDYQRVMSLGVRGEGCFFLFPK